MLRIVILTTTTLLWVGGQAQLSMGTPAAPLLTFPSVLGKKIVLAGNGNTNHTGIGIQSGIFQFYVPPDGTSAYYFNNAGFGQYLDPGYLKSLMMVSNTGNVGIAKTDPQFRLDLNGNMVLRNAGNNITAGIWLASNAGGLDPFFMGLQTDESFGFYWNPAPGGWRFSINPYYGSIMLNGSSGADGALLSSGGGAAAANWQLRSNRDFYALTREAQETTVYNLTDASPTANPTGLSVTQNYPEACKVEVLFNIQALGVACALCGITDFVVSVKLDGTVVKSFRYNAENGLVNTFNGANLLSVTAGNHTINLQIQKLSGPTLQLSNDASRFSNMNLVTTPTN